MLRRAVALLLLAGLTGWFPATAEAQSTLNIENVIIYRNAAQVSLRGILRFSDQKAAIDLPFQPAEGGLYLEPSEGLEVRYYRMARQSRSVKAMPRGWAQILRANANKEVTVIYQIGMDYEDISGEVARIDEEGDMLVLRKPGSDFFIPLSQIRQVAVDGQARLDVDREEEALVLEIGSANETPFAPVDLRLLTESMSWTPKGSLRPAEGGMLFTEEAVVVNHGAPVSGVPVFLGAGKAGDNQTTDPIELGKLQLARGEQMTFRLQQATLPFTESVSVEIPWADRTEDRSAAANRVLLMDPPEIAVVADTVRMLTPAGTQTDRVAFEMTDKGQLRAEVPARQVNATIRETIVKRGKKPEMVDGRSMIKVEGEGLITLRSHSEASLDLSVTRELAGTFADSEGANVSAGENGMSQARWKMNIRPGASREIRYTFEAYIPANP